MTKSRVLEMVHIKKVEIYGLKSFGYKNTIVNMEKGMVCITGPNGSGKSNILDAIMFALGENSPKALRVDKLHSLFHDTGAEGKVHRLVRASVSFDNSDRGIPMDSGTVTITREMPPEGESEYYLNGKKVTKATVTDLLEIVRAAPNRLNAVQQGMIMRIAELNAEERRKIIEDIMGLSYFDEKKEEAMKQLTEADRRLEIAMAKMGEIRKRIDDLEEERNNQLRFQHLEKDIRRFKAIKLSNSIKSSREQLAAQKVTVQQNLAEAERLGNDLEEIKGQLTQLEGERSKFLQEVDVSSRSKAEVDTRISTALVRFEQLRAGIAASEQRLKSIGETIPSLIKEKETMKKKIVEINTTLHGLNAKIQMKQEQKGSVASELDKLNAEINELINKQSSVTEQQIELERDLKSAEEIRGNLNLEITSSSEREKILVETIDGYVKRLKGIALEQQKLYVILAQLERLKQEEQRKISNYDETISKLTNKRSKIEQQIDSTALMLEKAAHVATRYETKIQMTKDANQEEYAITVLLEKAKDFGIIGIFQQLIRWGKEHERAVLAVASAWMKALVIKDVGKMIKVLENAKKLQLPRLRMIPLDIVMSEGERNLPVANAVLGFLSNFVTSNKAPNLIDFIFGDIILVESADVAFELAKQGYKTVTLAGELFEPKASAVVLDLNSKITDITKTILLGESVDGLKNSLDLLRQLINKKKSELNDLGSRIKKAEGEKVNSQTSLTAIDSQIENVEASLQRLINSVREIETRTNASRANHDAIKEKLRELNVKRSEIDERINLINSKLSSIDKQGIAKVVDEVNLRKLNITSTLEDIEKEIREQFTVISAQRAEFDNVTKRINDLNDELSRIKVEAKEKAFMMRNSTTTLKNLETELKEFRDKEQQIIDTSGNSVGLLKEYDDKIKILADSERKLTKQLGNVEKAIALNQKDIGDLTASEAKLVVELSEYGYSELIEGFDVGIAVNELIREYEYIKGSINQLADKTYVLTIDGYRGMSARKNQLESERNSIVRFIEDIEKEKKQIFMEAFQKVDKDVRYIFSTMTAGTGSAWLEIENPDDVFASGLAFLAQFPGKPARESTGLSGGEKTMAATTFLLALQTLKPSPFYLFDEIDAHLDAQNTERLAKIIVEKSKASQMIVVSLKDAIVANAQLVHGVYPRSGISQVIKYRVNAPVASE
jgi:chromosome segregation protein